MNNASYWNFITGCYGNHRIAWKVLFYSNHFEQFSIVIMSNYAVTAIMFTYSNDFGQFGCPYVVYVFDLILCVQQFHFRWYGPFENRRVLFFFLFYLFFIRILPGVWTPVGYLIWVTWVCGRNKWKIPTLFSAKWPTIGIFAKGPCCGQFLKNYHRLVNSMLSNLPL